ncbi:MAG: hypothetical protein P1V51_16920 [Deltaproteobacteria bacterium]|nr:hypothetical protein [Deltaproteobacteria bacterium]
MSARLPTGPSPTPPPAVADPAGASARIRRRAHLITAGILGGTGAFIWLIWAHPMVLLYGALLVVAVMAYAAVYLMVTARLEDDEFPPDNTLEPHDALEHPALDPPDAPLRPADERGDPPAS